MDYFAVMNSGTYSSEGSYQHEVIVGDEDPSLSFATSPTWGHSLDEELLAVDYADALAGITSVSEHEEDNDSDSCNGPEDAIDGMSDCSAEIKDNPFVILQKGTENKRKRGIDKVEEAENEDYSQLLAGCKIIKKECSSGYLEGILGISKNDDEDSSQSDNDDRGSLNDVDVKRESRR